MSTFDGLISGNAGTALGREGTTIKTFAISLASGLVLFGVQFTAFLIVRNYLWAKRIYQPRSFLVPVKDRVKPPSNKPWKWLIKVLKTPVETEVLQKSGMDAYFFLRYLRMCLKIFLPSAILILPILIPLNVIDGKDTRTIGDTSYNITGLDTLAWSNVSPENTNRYWAHLVLAVMLIVWVCFVFHEELMHFVKRRQEFLGSASHRLKASSTTVLITDISKEICTIEQLTAMYDDFPGGVRRIWLNRNLDELVAKDKLRKRYEDQLENAETDLLRKAMKRYRKMQKQNHDPTPVDTNALEGSIRSQSNGVRGLRESKNTPTTQEMCQQDLNYDIETKAAWLKYIAVKERQSTRIVDPNREHASKLPFIGRLFSLKVDAIYYYRRELARLNREIDASIAASEDFPQNGSAFIQFNTQKAAHMACQIVADTMPHGMTQRSVEISPADINWSALNLTWGKRAIRLVVFIFLFILVVFIFGIISFLTGILSKASTLADSTSWLRWISSLPAWLLSFIQGTLPPFIQIVVLSGPTPIVLRKMTNSTRGATTGSQGERSLQRWYFVLLFTELFIIPTISSGLTTLVAQLLEDAGSVPKILATYLPTAANYYFSFLIVQALSISASSILQTIRLLNFYGGGSKNTPDKVFQKLSFINRTRIGSNIPWYTTFAAIGLVYSVIAPLMLVFMLITFGLFYIIIKNNLLYVVRTGNVDSGGLWFPSAINQTFTGLYFMEACLIGLFFLVRDTGNNVACKTQGIVMAVVLILTIAYQIWLTVNFHGLFTYTPLRLEIGAAQQDRLHESTRLTASTPSSDDERTVGELAELEKLSEGTRTTGTRTAASTTMDAVQENHDLSLTTSHNPIHRPSSIRSDALAGRTRDMEVKQTLDKHKAASVLARLNRPLDERRLAELEVHLNTVEYRVGNVLLPRREDVEAQMMNDPISKIIMQHNDELEDLSPEDRDMLISVAFTHPVLRETKPSVWIPTDECGVSDDEVRRTREFSEDLVIDNRGAYFNRKLKVEIDKPPPDMSEFALVMAEL